MKAPLMPGDVVAFDVGDEGGRAGGGGRRTAVILSPSDYNVKTGCALACPIVANGNGYPFAVPVGGTAGTDGAVLADFVRRIDWRARRPARVGRIGEAALADVLGRLRALLDAHL